jgi:hypothetical protein
MKRTLLLALSATFVLGMPVAQAADPAKDTNDFVLGMFAVSEQEEGLSRVKLPACRDSANEVVGAMRFVVKRYPIDVSGIAVIFSSASDLLLEEIKSFADLKAARDAGRLNSVDFEVYEAPSVQAVLDGSYKKTYAPDQASPILDIDKNASGPKCVRTILFKGASGVSGENKYQRAQIILFGSRYRSGLTTIANLDEAAKP